MEELREKIIGEIEGHENDYHDHLKYGLGCNTPIETTDKILSLFSCSIKNIEWVGECPECKNGWLEKCGHPFRGKSYLECSECKGTGKITQPATIEEVLEKMGDIVSSACEAEILLESVREGEYTPDSFTTQPLRRARTINNGQLRIKEN